MKRDIVNYFDALTGFSHSLEKVAVALPPYLDRYVFYRTRVLGMPLVLAEVKNDEQTPLEYQRAEVKLESNFGVPVAFVFTSLPTNKRNALLRHRVSFVIPGRQIFLPPILELREHEPVTIVVGDRLHFPAQAIVLYEILHGGVAMLSLKDLGARLGFSAMSMTTAAKELRSTRLAEIGDGVRRRIAFVQTGQSLWETAIPYMSSPVKKRLLLAADVAGLPTAGITALSERTMISGDRQVVRAISEAAYRRLSGLKTVETLDEAIAVLEVWGYDPLILGDGKVNDFSLWLSLQQEARVDPRVEDALESLMEEHQWR